MNVLALEPYYGGSHKAFLDGWIENSRHHWTVMGLPAYKWKWRMRHAPLTLAKQLRQQSANLVNWDIVFCSDMLALCEFRGLADLSVARLPAVIYFHENQLTYPVRDPQERDFHFAFTNFSAACAAERVWFNSAFHRNEFLTALREFLGRMPDYLPHGDVDRILEKSAVYSPGIVQFPARDARPAGPLRILWAARWEHDKDPDTFFAAIKILANRGVDFRISVIGQSFREIPATFRHARESFADRIDRWGYQSTRDDYVAALMEADVIVSTARHEFFGISVVEAIAAGAYPILPNRLSYPEIMQLDVFPNRIDSFFYDGSAADLAERLACCTEQVDQQSCLLPTHDDPRDVVARFRWERIVGEMDDALEELAMSHRVDDSGHTIKTT